MMRERETREDLKGASDQFQQVPSSVYGVQTHLCTGPELAFEPLPDECAGGTSPAAALLATLLKKEPESRKDMPTSGYSQNICIRLSNEGP